LIRPDHHAMHVGNSTFSADAGAARRESGRLIVQADEMGSCVGCKREGSWTWAAMPSRSRRLWAAAPDAYRAGRRSAATSRRPTRSWSRSLGIVRAATETVRPATSGVSGERCGRVPGSSARRSWPREAAWITPAPVGRSAAVTTRCNSRVTPPSTALAGHSSGSVNGSPRVLRSRCSAFRPHLWRTRQS